MNIGKESTKPQLFRCQKDIGMELSRQHPMAHSTQFRKKVKRNAKARALTFFSGKLKEIIIGHATCNLPTKLNSQANQVQFPNQGLQSFHFTPYLSW